MKKVFIIHGYNASPAQHWFPWLKQQIENAGISCDVIQLTHAEQPDYHEWKRNLTQQVTLLNDESIIVAHSLGGLASLDFLSQALNGRVLKAIFLVAGFASKLTALPELNSFIDQAKVDDALLRLHIKKRFLFFSNNDQYVPAPLSIGLGHLLNAQMIEVKGAGHFMLQDGYQAFPELWEKLEVLLKS